MAETITFPEEAARLAALAQVDYREAFAFDTTADLTAEAWARLIFEEASQAMRAALLQGWEALGVNLAPLDADERVLGWRIQHRESEAIVLGVDSSLGFTARMVIQVQPGRVVHAMLFRFDQLSGRDAFMALTSQHTQAVQSLLDDANRRATSSPRLAPEGH